MMKFVIATALGLALTGCGAATRGDNSAAAALGDNSAAAAAVAASPKDASQIAASLVSAGLKLQNIKAETAESDDNHLLGRPGQYTSKVFFYDSRHPKPGAGNDEGENTIEVFANAADAKRRKDYIENVTKDAPFMQQYMVLQGPVLARFDKVLLPAEVEQYKKALAQVVPQ